LRTGLAAGVPFRKLRTIRVRREQLKTRYGSKPSEYRSRGAVRQVSGRSVIECRGLAFLVAATFR
jgi:hypothetical protein